jgi:hypothetical protein
MLGDAPKKTVIVRLTLNDIFTQIKDRQIQKMFLCEIKDIQYPAGAAVAVCKGMDDLELIVDQGEFNQGINLVFGVNIVLKVFEFIPDDGLAFRRGENHLSG